MTDPIPINLDFLIPGFPSFWDPTNQGKYQTSDCSVQVEDFMLVLMTSSCCCAWSACFFCVACALSAGHSVEYLNPFGFLLESLKKTSGQITIIPKPELRGFWGDSLTKPPFGVTTRRKQVAIICPERCFFNRSYKPRQIQRIFR